jgi:hypothetical protein
MIARNAGSAGHAQHNLRFGKSYTTGTKTCCVPVITTTTIDLLAAGFKELGFQVVARANGFTIHNRSFSGRESTGTYIKGVFNVPERWNLDLNRVKQAYSAQVVMSQAKRFGWNLTRKSATEFEVQRRS